MLNLGTIYYTSGISSIAKNDPSFLEEIITSLTHYYDFDWGDIPEDDKELNRQALIEDERIFAAYPTSYGQIFIITEWDRSMTTVMFSEEY